MALLSQRHFGRDVSRLSAEMDRLREEFSGLAEEVDDQRNRLRSRLATMATVSHEIRSPLAAVIALGDLLGREPLSDAQQSMVHDLVDAGRLIMHVVNDSLDYAKSETAPGLGAPKRFNLQELLNRVSRSTQLLAASNSGLEVVTLPSPVRWIEGHEAHLQQVLTNLCVNALKFTTTGTIRISVAELESTDGGKQRLLRFSVQDSGSGINAHERSRLFLPYSQLPAGDGRSTVGTGLGLYVCRRLVETMGGKIDVQSEPGAGSEFYFTLPITMVPEGEESTALESGADARQVDNGISDGIAKHSPLLGSVIGVVDDARINREVARRVVESHGGSCVLFESGEELLLHARTGILQVDLVLMDVEMPGTNGLQAAAALRSMPAYSGTPIVAVSGADNGDLQNCVTDGTVDGFLPKPYHAQALVQIILAHQAR